MMDLSKLSPVPDAFFDTIIIVNTTLFAEEVTSDSKTVVDWANDEPSNVKKESHRLKQLAKEDQYLLLIADDDLSEDGFVNIGAYSLTKGNFEYLSRQTWLSEELRSYFAKNASGLPERENNDELYKADIGGKFLPKIESKSIIASNLEED